MKPKMVTPFEIKATAESSYLFATTQNSLETPTGFKPIIIKSGEFSTGFIFMINMSVMNGLLVAMIARAALAAKSWDSTQGSFA